MEKQGFIFVNEVGQYAVTTLSSGFGPTREVIGWVSHIDDAKLFPHENIARRLHDCLKNCQCLKVVEERRIYIRNWGTTE